MREEIREEVPQIVRAELETVLEHNIMPQFEYMHQKFAEIDGRFGRIEATMVTKDYLDDKLADLKGEMILLHRRQEQKTDALTECLLVNRALTNEDVRLLEARRIFPKPQ